MVENKTMALTNFEKRDLATYVKRRIELGYNCRDTIKGLERLGFKAGTIRKYYKIFKPKGEKEGGIL